MDSQEIPVLKSRNEPEWRDENTRLAVKDFIERTELPAFATREGLASLGARYLTTEPFNHKDLSLRLEQMQYLTKNREYGCIWKRIVKADDKGESKIPFHIHIEISEDGNRHYILKDEFSSVL